MKRLFCVMLVLLLCVLSGCAAIEDLMLSIDPASEFSYEGWKTVELIDYGTIKIPTDWEVHEEGGY